MSENNDGYFDVYENENQEVNENENGQNIGSLTNKNENVQNNGTSGNGDDPEVSQIKKRVKEMEEEAAKLKQLQTEMEQHMQTSGLSTPVTLEDKLDADSRSIYVGNVDYSATAQELEAHFHGCGSINRVTILCDKFSGHPKGFAYIEFADKDSVQTAMALDDSLFKGRQIKVTSKRTNKPGISSTDRGRGGSGRGMGFPMRGRGGMRGGGIGVGGGYSPYMPSFRGRGGLRGRGARGYYHYAPY